MKVYLPKPFQRDAKREGITESSCQEAIRRAESGLIDADLGRGLIKQRVARPGQGRSGGWRTVIYYKRGDIAIFMHLFAKSGKANLTAAELNEYFKMAQSFDGLTVAMICKLLESKEWRELPI